MVNNVRVNERHMLVGSLPQAAIFKVTGNKILENRVLFKAFGFIVDLSTGDTWETCDVSTCSAEQIGGEVTLCPKS